MPEKDTMATTTSTTSPESGKYFQKKPLKSQTERKEAIETNATSKRRAKSKRADLISQSMLSVFHMFIETYF